MSPTDIALKYMPLSTVEAHYAAATRNYEPDFQQKLEANPRPGEGDGEQLLYAKTLYRQKFFLQTGVVFEPEGIHMPA
jgi:hypothetical protein